LTADSWLTSFFVCPNIYPGLGPRPESSSKGIPAELLDESSFFFCSFSRFLIPLEESAKRFKRFDFL